MDQTTDLTRDRDRSTTEGGRDVDRSASPIDQIRADIDKTREETIRTINELERRLAPSHLMAQLKEQVREKTRQATVGRASAMAKQTSETSKRFGSALYDTLRSNPVPAMLVGGGLAWLIANGMRREDYSEEEELGFADRRKSVGTDVTGTYGMGFIDRRRPSAEAARETSQEKAGRIKADLQSRAEEGRRKADQVSQQVRAKASQAGEQVRAKAADLGSAAAGYGRRAQERLAQSGKSARAGFFHTLESNPLAAAGVVMAAGAVIGMLFPETRYEDETLGPRRNEMLERVRDKGREKIEKVEAVVREAKESAKDEADRQGLISRDKADEAEQKAGRLTERFKTEAEEKTAGFKSRFEEKSTEFMEGSPGIFDKKKE